MSGRDEDRKDFGCRQRLYRGRRREHLQNAYGETCGPIEVNEAMTYKEMAIRSIRLACQDLIDRAEKIIPDINSIFNVEIVLSIPTLTDKIYDIPRLTVTTNAYPDRTLLEKVYPEFLTK
jgi:hypothetical protein